MDKSEEEKDIERTLNKIPQLHRSLIDDYVFKFHGGNTLNGDDEHVGYVDPSRKEIAVAAPYNYSREMTFLHEVGHRVWDTLVTPEQKAKWKKIINNTKNKQNQSAEELFCMAYAATYSKNPPTIHDHDEWKNFIRELSK